MTPSNPLPSWLEPLWRDLIMRRKRLPHALLLLGAAGSGKRSFAEYSAQALLCASGGVDGPCGVCEDCRWFASDNHPDMIRVVPAADLEDEGDADSPAEGAGGKKEKAKSTQILIDQVRALQQRLEVGRGGHSGGFRIVIIEPAEAMNIAAANALLKLLEEPGVNTVFLLITHAPRLLLPTIRSRCQSIEFPKPDFQVALNWLAERNIPDAEALLGFSSGLPMMAERLQSSGLWRFREQLAADLSRLTQIDPLKMAANWEAKLKAKDAIAVGFDTPTLVAWLQAWLSDGVRVSQGIKPRFYPDQSRVFQGFVEARQRLWLPCFRELNEFRRIAQHPLNLRLFLEEMFLIIHRRIIVARGAT